MALPIRHSNIKILVIDDEPLNILALCAVLKSRGFTTVTANSAKEGINILLKNKDINLVLMDMMMPETDGYEATNQIKNHEEIAHIPVIAVTAQAMSHDREKCLQAGAKGYISKPIDIELLTRAINDLV